MKAYAVLLCAGSARRTGINKNKIFADIDGVPAALKALRAIDNSGCFKGVICAVRKQDEEELKALFKEESIPVSYVYGGAERGDSVYNALKALPEDADTVSIHDAARCFTSPELIKRCVLRACESGAAAVGRYSVDTVKQVKDGKIVSTLDRSDIVLIETPQAFRADIIKKAYENAALKGIKGTDDCYLAECIGVYPEVVDHNEMNMKLTFKEDLKKFRCEDDKQMRVGFGYDAHRLVPERKLVLGGMEIPHEKGLLGHSDADVLTHAVIDALLGAAALGDIGRLFPDDEMKYKDIYSIKLLKEAYDAVKKEGYFVKNIDVTVTAQRPKLKNYIDDMRRNIAKSVCTDIKNVSVKATTTEKMGFEGREEGVSATAVCLIEK